MDKVNEEVVNCGVGSPKGDPDLQRKAFLDEFPSLKEKRLVLYLSRIHVKKGCDLLLNAFGQIAKQIQTSTW